MHTCHIVAGWSRALSLLGPGLLVSLVLANAAPAFAQQDDPFSALEDENIRAFKQALRPGLEQDPEKRKAELEDAAKKVKGLPNVAYILLLRDWEDRDPTDPTDKSVDRVVRKQVLDRFDKELIEVLDKGDDATRAAALTLLGEFAIRARFAVPASLSNNRIILRRFPEYATLITGYLKKEKSSDVFRAAELALTSLRPGSAAQRDSDVEREMKFRESWQAMLGDLSKKVVAALEISLKGKESVERRRLAAEGLVSLVRVPVLSTDRYSPGQSGNEGPEEIVAFGREVVPAAAAALSDEDAIVRKNAADALQTAAVFVNENLRSRKTSDKDLPRPTDKPDQVRAGPPLKSYTPLLVVLWRQTKSLATASDDANPEVRLAARRTLDALGETRQNWLLYKGPAFDPKKGGARAPQNGAATIKFEEVFALTALQNPAAKDALLEPLLDTTDALVRGLGDPVIENRRAAAEALESILANENGKPTVDEVSAARLAPSIKGLVRALADRDRFVRWIATRTLGRIGPVPGLEATTVSGLARVLSDPDVDVELQAALALELYGAPAQDAVGALVRAAQSGDTEVRVEALYAIQQTGAKNAAEVTVQLGALLSDPIVRIRRAAAETLGTFGPGARPAKDALVRALKDPDAEVRRKASRAILQLQKEPR